MTLRSHRASFAFILGVLPLVISSGAVAEGRLFGMAVFSVMLGVAKR